MPHSSMVTSREVSPRADTVTNCRGPRVRVGCHQRLKLGEAGDVAHPLLLDVQLHAEFFCQRRPRRSRSPRAVRQTTPKRRFRENLQSMPTQAPVILGFEPRACRGNSGNSQLLAKYRPAARRCTRSLGRSRHRRYRFLPNTTHISDHPRHRFGYECRARLYRRGIEKTLSHRGREIISIWPRTEHRTRQPLHH